MCVCVEEADSGRICCRIRAFGPPWPGAVAGVSARPKLLPRTPMPLELLGSMLGRPLGLWFVCSAGGPQQKGEVVVFFLVSL